MRQGSYKTFVDYLEEIANRHPQIMAYHDLEEAELIADKLRTSVTYPILLVEYPDMGFADNKVNLDRIYTTGVACLINVPRGDNDRQKEVLATTEAILLDILSYIRNDRRQAKLWIETNDVQMAKVGPKFTDNCYGWRMELRFRSWADLEFKAAEWQDYNPNKWQ